MSAVTVNPELTNALKRLRLGGLLPTLAERLALCEAQSLPYQDVLLLLLADEISRRESGAATRRAQQAGLSPDMVLSRWDASAKVLPRPPLPPVVAFSCGLGDGGGGQRHQRCADPSAGGLM